MFINTERLITEVRAHPELWDASSKLYKSREARQAAWQDICATLIKNFNELDDLGKFTAGKNINRRWKTARDAYIKTKTELKNSKSMTKKYIYYDMLKFLDSDSKKYFAVRVVETGGALQLKVETEVETQCRVCLAHGRWDLLSEAITEKIMTLANIKISPDDDLPKSICLRCVRRLNTSYEFKLECERSDVILRSQQAKQITDIPEEITCAGKEIIKSALEEDHTRTDATTDETPLNVISTKEVNIEKVKAPQKRQKQCFTCGKIMSSLFRLKMHMRTHTGERPYSCVYCNKTFAIEQSMKVHVRVHTGEKPLKCKLCDKSFAQSAGLIAHVRLHTGQRPYLCTHCPLSFRTASQRQYHIRTHTGEKKFVCETCGKAFIRRCDMIKHAPTHTGERPHVCCVCGLRLARASHLNRHMAIHNDIRPYACHMCPSRFIQKTDLAKHSKKHTSKYGQDKSAKM